MSRKLRLLVNAHARSLEIGRHLDEAGRRTLAVSLGAALTQVKAGPAK
jgi:uncharacterized membrane protein